MVWGVFCLQRHFVCFYVNVIDIPRKDVTLFVVITSCIYFLFHKKIEKLKVGSITNIQSEYCSSLVFYSSETFNNFLVFHSKQSQCVRELLICRWFIFWKMYHHSIAFRCISKRDHSFGNIRKTSSTVIFINCMARRPAAVSVSAMDANINYRESMCPHLRRYPHRP